MQQWYHAEGSRQVGPLPVDDIVAAYHAGRITADTLVWHEGMAQWQALRTVADELGIDLTVTVGAASAVPPPLPPRHGLDHVAPGPRAGAPVAAHGATPYAATAPATKPRRPLWVTLLIIAGVGGVLLVPILAILAAIALPAYQQYTLRAKVQQAHAALYAHRLAVVSFIDSEGRCPTNDDDGFLAMEDYADGYLATVEMGHFDNGNCAIEAVLQDINADQLDGKRLWLDYDSEQQQWECSSDADDKYLPMECRG